ncbi:hypothetical protein ADL27_35710, partial [Streptomyces sp. NRRL F-6602]
PTTTDDLDDQTEGLTGTDYGILTAGTVLTLVLVPTLYAMVELRKERRAAKKAAKREGKADVPGQGGTPAEEQTPEPARS